MDADRADLTGRILAHYRVAERIGAGGMGEVYRARDTRLDRDVAIKVLPPEAAADPGRCRRFESEAKVVAALKHPNIVTIHSVEEADGIRFLTMELVEGTTLCRELGGGGISVARFLEIAVPLVDAVACAHAQGIVHRDLKPGNVMIASDGRLKVLDFGLAKLWAEAPGDPQATVPAALTRTGTTVGTPAYMAPEQIAGRGADARSDVFSLGILFHELLSGRHPFAADYPAAVMVRIVGDEPPPLAGVPDAVAAVVARCLRKDPAARFASGEELRGALEALKAPTPAGTRTAVTVSMVAVDPGILEAMKRGAWEEASAALQALAAQRELAGEELEALAATQAWLSRYDDYVRTLEKAHTLYVSHGRAIAAARVALELNENYDNLDPKPALARGWLRRAERLLADQPECLEQGRLARRWFVEAIAKCDLDRAEEMNRRCAEIAERVGDADLRIVALHDRGRILVARGEEEEGSALVDEAMAAALAGEVSLITVGTLFCRTLWVCKAVADYDRALEWTEAATRWSEAHAVSAFPGICRVHSAETLRRHGRWRDAERAVRAACDFFVELGPDSHAGEAFNELGELALRKGDLDEADDAFRRAHEYGYDPVPGLPLLRLAQGNAEAAFRMIDRALAECPDDRLRRASLLSARVEVGLALGQVESAKGDAAELETIAQDYRCPAFRASAAMATGSVLLAQGEAAAAVAPLREARSTFQGGGFAHDAARARVLLARAYRGSGALEDARLELDAAHKTFVELGARMDRELVERLVADGR